MRGDAKNLLQSGERDDELVQHFVRQLYGERGVAFKSPAATAAFALQRARPAQKGMQADRA